jgi:dienelactone hydrolase
MPEQTHPKSKISYGQPAVWLLICLAILVGAMMLASAVQKDFGNVHVSNVTYRNFNGIPVRAKLLQPDSDAGQQTLPGVVYIHGYQNNRETGDAYCIELARRGFVVLNIDAIGRGNSGIPKAPTDPNFDSSYGGLSALNYLRTLPNVDPQALGMMGHSLGAEMAYQVAMQNPSVKALVITGFAYTTAANKKLPRNMLMIIGKWDEFRDRMTHTRDIAKEWMDTPETRSVISHPQPQTGVTYGDFEKGTARRVVIPNTIHIQESHSRLAIAESLMWMKQALSPPAVLWTDPDQQIWPVKEWATLVAMLAGLWSLIPLGSLLIRLPFFKDIHSAPSTRYTCSKNKCFRYAFINGLLMWLYLPLIFVLFGIHIYIVHIDKVFPMMMVNAIVWWFVWVNVIGFFLFRRWFKKNKTLENLSLSDLGISYNPDYFYLQKNRLAKTALLACVLFGFAYLSEHLLEQIFIVDYRFIFPFASDLTPYRVKMALLYFPFLLLGFLQTGVFLHGQMRRPESPTPIRTFFYWSWTNIMTMILPLLLFMAVQYVPLFLNGFIPLVGPGGMFVSFVINLFHIVGVLIVVIPLSTWLFQLTGKIYLGAMTSAALVSWMFASSQVIAPIPI